jgi:hypothetical protein
LLADGIAEGLKWRFPKWLLITVKNTESEAQSAITPPSVVHTTAGGSDPDPGPDKSSASVSEIEMIPLSTSQHYTQTLNFGQPRRAWTTPTASHS